MPPCSKWNIMYKISKVEVVVNLERAIDFACGKSGLNTLIHGWLEYHKYGAKYRHAVHARKWLYWVEVRELSAYAGYDLSKKSP